MIVFLFFFNYYAIGIVGKTLPPQGCGNVPSGSGDGQEITHLAAKLGSSLSMQGTIATHNKPAVG